MACDATAILNWRQVDRWLSLSGQPSADQLRALARDGVRCVINLGPHDSPKALPGEADIVADLGMRYVYIPVDFAAPSAGDFTAFCAALDALPETRVHIHCIYNARVTAFMLRRAQDGRGGAPATARAVMESIWRPGGVWATFLGDTANATKPHRYVGYDD